jgi:hypothetical protein
VVVKLLCWPYCSAWPPPDIRVRSDNLGAFAVSLWGGLIDSAGWGFAGEAPVGGLKASAVERHLLLAEGIVRARGSVRTPRAASLAADQSMTGVRAGNHTATETGKPQASLAHPDGDERRRCASAHPAEVYLCRITYLCLPTLPAGYRWC